VSSDDPLVVATAAAQGYRVLECEQCAANVKQALHTAGHHGEVIKIRGQAGGDFIVCLSYDGGAATITQNGRHVAVRIGAVVVDNLHPGGVPFDAWLRDFDAIGGITVRVTAAF
jgi:hypothetical protein